MVPFFFLSIFRFLNMIFIEFEKRIKYICKVNSITTKLYELGKKTLYKYIKLFLCIMHSLKLLHDS